MKILIIEDNRVTRERLKEIFTNDNYEVFSVSNSYNALEVARREYPDLIILDLMLGDSNGLEICDHIRSKQQVYGNPHILMLTGKDTHEDLIVGFQHGADDYLKKPFEEDELLYRVKSILKRREVTNGKIYKYKDIVLNEDTLTVTENGVDLKLASKNFLILKFLIENIGIVVSRKRIFEYIWQEKYYESNRIIDIYIGKLKKNSPVLKENIETVIGYGYKLKK